MANFTRFYDEIPGCRTPDPLAPHDGIWAKKASDFFEDGSSDEEDAGSRTPDRVANVNIEALRVKLQQLEAEKAKCLEDIGMAPPPGLTSLVENCLDGDIMKVVMNSHLTQPFGAASSSLPIPPPLPHPEPRFAFQEQEAAAKVQHAPSLMKEQVVSKGSVGHPFHCGPACKFVKRKGGCQAGADCPKCHHCFWSKAHAGSRPKPKPEDAMLLEAQSLANKLVTLLGGEEPFGGANKPRENKAVSSELSVGTQGHPHSCAEACKYVRRKGGCMHGEACLKCHACIWSRSDGKDAKNLSSGVGFGAVVEGVRGRDARDGISSSGATFSALANDMQGHIAIPKPIISINEALGSPPRASTNPTWGLSPPAELPQEIPASVRKSLPPNQGYAWHSSVGSTGHPTSCGPACKYAMKPRGCKDGRLCSHCHLCRWMRYGVRTGHKQPIEITAWTSL